AQRGVVRADEGGLEGDRQGALLAGGEGRAAGVGLLVVRARSGHADVGQRHLLVVRQRNGFGGAAVALTDIAEAQRGGTERRQPFPRPCQGDGLRAVRTIVSHGEGGRFCAQNGWSVGDADGALGARRIARGGASVRFAEVTRIRAGDRDIRRVQVGRAGAGERDFLYGAGGV